LSHLLVIANINTRSVFLTPSLLRNIVVQNTSDFIFWTLFFLCGPQEFSRGPVVADSGIIIRQYYLQLTCGPRAVVRGENSKMQSF